MDADAMARELLFGWMPQANRDVGMAELRAAIAAALRRAHDAGRVEAIEEIVQMAEFRYWPESFTARIRALKEVPHG